jgi:hypothetical protein
MLCLLPVLFTKKNIRTSVLLIDIVNTYGMPKRRLSKSTLSKCPQGREDVGIPLKLLWPWKRERGEETYEINMKP